ncbi:MAG: hypothetical protein JWM36_3512 [Hyphomicrobiales bacterium]|nr:hypothetical protein [Hyphomicrobiales bacterium]
MNDNSNHKAPRPRKAGASKGGPRGGARNARPGASGGGKSGAPKFGGAKSGGSKSAERPRSRSDAKPAGKSFGDKPFGDKPFRKAPGGERPMRRREESAESAPRVYAPKEYSPKPPKGPPAKHFDKPRRVVRAEPLTAPSTFEGERIAKTMARVGLCSRRDAEAWIAEGRVAVNGEVLTTPAVNVTMQDRITVDGKPLAARERTRLFLFNKPRGLVTTDHDPEGRATIFDALPADLPRVVTIGRLDINTEGLLLLTNDGGLARVLELPSTGWLRRYRVRANGTTDQAQLDELRKGITIEGIDYAGIEANLDRVQGANVWLTMGLREGKNREIKRVLEHLGLAVNRLIRLSYGPFQLGDLADGAVEEVRTRIIADQIGPALAAEAGADFEGPVAQRGEVPQAREREEEAPRPRKGAPRSPGRSSSREPEAVEKPRLDRPQPGPRKHVSVLRAGREADTMTARRRIERGETADRKGRTVSVERVVAPVKKGGSRNARRFAEERAPQATSGERPMTGRNAKAPAARPDRRGERPRAPFREAPSEGRSERTFTKPAGDGKPFSKPRGEGRGRPDGDAGKRDFVKKPGGDRPGRSFSKPGEGGGRPGGGGGRPGGRPAGAGRPAGGGGRPGGAGGKGPKGPPRGARG